MNNNEELLKKGEKKAIQQEYKKILPEDEIKKVREVLSEVRSDDAKLLQSLPSNQGKLENEGNTGEDIIKKATVYINPNTGEKSVSEEDIDTKLSKLLDIDIEDLYKLPESASDIPYDTELIKNNATNYGLTDADVAALLPIIDKYRSGEKLNWYNVLPDKIKDMINKECLAVNNISVAAKKLFAEELIKGIIRDAGIDRVIIDFQQAVNKAFDISGIMKMTLDYQSTIFEKKYLEIIEKLEKSGNTEKAELLRKVCAAYKQSYTYEDFIKAVKSGKIKVKDFDRKKYKRFISEFNYKYEKDTPFIIEDISKMAPILLRKFSAQFTVEQIINFVIAFCKYTGNMDAKYVVDHTFMSYAIINIINIELITKDQEETAFTNILLNNIESAIKIVNNI
jgi:hypothetical protein